MSYILDALKKSERRRPPGPVPDLFTVQGPQQPSPPRPRWIGFAAGAVVAAALVAGWAWLGRDGGAEGGRTPPASVAPEASSLPAKDLGSPVPASPGTPAVPEAAPAPAVSAAGTRRASPGPPRPAGPASPALLKPPSAPAAAEEPPPVAQAASPLSPAPALTPAAATPAATPAEAPPSATIVPAAAPPQPPAEGAPVAASPQPPPAAESARETTPLDPPALAEAAPPADGRVLEAAELPAAIRAELPKLVISGHVWSEEPSMRMLTVDDRILREGAEAAPGARLEEITPGGAVIVFKGWRYRVGGFRQ